MSVPHRSCTCEAHFVSVPTPLHIRKRVSSSFQRLHILEAHFNASYIGSASPTLPYIIWQIKKEMKIFLYQIYLHIVVEPAVPVLTTGSYVDDVDNMQMCAADFPHTLHALNSRLSGRRLQPALRICTAQTKKGEKTLVLRQSPCRWFRESNICGTVRGNVPGTYQPH